MVRSAYQKDLETYVDNLNEISKSGKKATADLDGFNNILISQGKQSVKTTTFLQDIGNGLKSVGKTALSIAGNVGIDLLVSAGLQLAATGIDKLIHQQENAIERGNKALEEYQNTNASMAQSTTWVTTNAQRYEELAKGVSYLGENLGLTSDEFAEYQELSSQIAQQFPSLVTGYNSMGQPIIGTARSVDELNQALKNQKIEEYSKSLSKAEDVADKMQAEVFQDKNWIWEEAGIQNQIESLEKFREDYNKAISSDIPYDEKHSILYGLDQFKYDQNFMDAINNAGVSTSEFFALTDELFRSEGKLSKDSQNLDTLNTIMDYASNLDTQLESASNSIRGYLPVFLQAQEAYQDLVFDNPEIESQMTAMTQAFSLDQMKALDFFDPDKGVNNIKKWANNAVRELENSDMQDALNDVFTMNDDMGEKTFGEWRREADAALDHAEDVSQSLTGAWDREQMRQASGIADQWQRLRDMQDDIEARWVGMGETARNSLSIDDFETIADLAIDDSFTGTYQQALTQIQEIQRASQLSLEAMQSNVTSAQENLSSFSTALSESASATGLTEDSITALGTAFADLENYNTDAMFTRSAEGMKLNTEALEGFIDAQYRVKEQDFADAIQEQNKAILEQQEAIRSNTDLTEDEITAKEAELDTMYDQLDAMKRAQSEYNALYQQQKALMSDYQQILDAEATENAGAHYEGIQSRLETYKEMYDKGLVGTDDFKEFAAYLSPNGFTDATNFLENYGKATRYFTEDESGIINFLNDLESKGLATLETLDDGTQQWKQNFFDIEDAAMQMGMGPQWFKDMFGRLEDYGGITNFAETAAEAGLSAEETASKLADAISRKAQLEAQGASQETLDSQQELIDQLTGQYEGYLETQDQLLASEPQKYAQSFQDAKEQLDILSKEIDKASGPLREKLIDDYESIASQYGIEYDPDTYTVNERTYQTALGAMGVGTWETPLTAEAMGFKEGSQEAQDYESSINALKQAHEANNAETENALDILSKYNEAQLEGIELSDGAYNVEGMEEAEDALQNLADQTGLTKDQLISALQGLGIITPEVDTTSLDEAQTKGEDAQRKFNELTGKTYDFDFETTNLDTIQKQIETIKQELGQYQTVGPNGEVTYDYSQPGAQEAADMYEASIRQQQYAEYQGSAMGQYESDNNIVKATQAFMQAKNELDIQTQLASEGMANDVEGATQNATTAFQALQDLGLGDWIDLTDLQSAEDSIQGLSQEEIDVKVGADASGAESEVQNLMNLAGSSITINADISTSGGVDELNEQLGSIPPGVETTVNVDVSGDDEVENLTSSMEQVPDDTPVTITCNVEDQEQLDQIEQKANELNASGKQIKIDATIGEVKPPETTVSQPVDLKGVVKDVTVEAETEPVELTGKIKANLDTSGLHQEQVAIVGQVVQVTGNPQTPVDVNGNLQSVNTDGVETPNVDVTGTLISVDPNGQTTSVDVSGALTGGIQGTEGQDGVVNFTADTSEPDSYQPDDKEATAVFDKDSSIPDSYQPDDKDALVNYGLGSTPNYDPPNLTRTVTYTIITEGSAPSGGAGESYHVYTGTATSIAHADGTAYNVLNTSPISPAHARGDITLPKNEKALVNEVGTESIVRDGVWSLLPGGAHIETLKKGDIIFSAAQTEALLKYGKIAGHARAYAAGSLETNAPQSLYSAYAGGGFSFSFQGGLSGRNTSSSSNSSSTSSNTSAQKANTAATNANTKATEENAEAAKDSTSVLDWVQNRLQYFSQKVQEIADTITDWISPAQKTSLLSKQVKAIDDEMHANYTGARTYYEKAQSLGLDIKTRQLIEDGKFNIEEIDTSTDAGKARYDLISEYQDYYDKYIDCINAVRELRAEQVEVFKQWADMPTETAEKKIEKLEQSFNGLTAIEARLEAADLGGSTQAALVEQLNQMKTSTENDFKNEYNKLVAAKTKENTALQNKNDDQKTLKNVTNQLKKGVSLTATERSRIAAGQTISTKGLTGRKKTLVTRYNNALKEANASSNTYDSVHQAANEARKTYSASKTAMNEYKKQYNTAMKYYNAGDSLSYQNYLVDAQLANTKQQNDAYQQAYQQAMKNTQTATTRKTVTANTLTAMKNKGKSFSQRYAKYISASQRKQLANGQKVNTTGIKNKNLLAILNRYNNQLQNAMNSYTAATQQLTAAQESEAEAAANAAQSQAEYAQAQIEAEQKKFENITNYYDRRIEYQQALAEVQEQERELSEAHGNYTKSTDYNDQIKAAQEAQKLQQEAAKKMQEQLDKSVKSGVIKESSDEWLEMKTQIVEAENAARDYNTQIENLKQEQIITQYEEMFDRAIEKAEHFIDRLETINQLITKEMMFDYDTGYLTPFGALAITLNAQELDSSLDNIASYVKKRQQIIDDYNKGKFGEEKYNELLSENDSSLQSAIQTADSYRQAIIQIITDQAEAEQEALFKVIDARKEALKKKKEYYDYDKQLKNQTQEINLLQQQIAALDGVTDAESRAQKARLEAQLKEQQDELDDTVRDHVYDLQINGLDELQDQLSEDLEKWAYELSANIDRMSEAINDAVNNVSGNTSDALNTIAEILKQFGINPSQIGITSSDLDTSDMKHYAKGTEKVQRKEVALTNEDGRELILTKDGLVTTLYPGEAVLNNETSKNLIKMAQMASMDDFSKNISVPSPEVIVKNQAPSFNYNQTFTVQGDLTRDTLPNLQTIMKKTCEYTQNEMRKNLRRFG